MEDIKMQNVEQERQERLAKGSKPETKETQSPAVESLKKAQKDTGKTLDKGLEDTFPASDPVSVTSPTTSGNPN
jgi:hypothetical protein